MDLRRAGPGEETALQAMLARAPLYNLFAITNLEAGLGPELEVWVERLQELLEPRPLYHHFAITDLAAASDAEGDVWRGEATGVLMRRGSHWLLDAGPDPERFPFAAAAAIMDGYPPEQVTGLVGVPESVEPLYAQLTAHSGRLYRLWFATLEGAPRPWEYAGSPRRARAGDVEEIAAVYAGAGDMRRTRVQVERDLPRTWVVEDQGSVTCVARLQAESRQAGMIGGVFTPEAHRRRGYASTLVHLLSRELHGRGKTACLFYYSRQAGRIYRRLGYRELGAWRMVRFGRRRG